jgi:hypothetical protein
MHKYDSSNSHGNHNNHHKYLCIHNTLQPHPDTLSQKQHPANTSKQAAITKVKNP